MSTRGSVVSLGKAELPEPKANRIIQQTAVWRQVVKRMANGEVEQAGNLVVDLGKNWGRSAGLRQGLQSFTTSLKRWIKSKHEGKYLVYTRSGVIYITPKARK
jgi:hypothetical protein